MLSYSSHGALPTFLVGLGRPNAEDGLAVDVASEATPDVVDYQSYLMDARKAVRDRYEATRCWQYEYDGLNPPPMTSNNLSANDESGTNKQHCDNNPLSEISTPYGSGPVSLTEEEDKEFWNLMR